jgi:hypothetical protein
MTTITTAPISGVNTSRADFVKSKFDILISEKGYKVIHEKALRCSCVSRNGNQLTSCKNCGGSSWVFINPTETRMVIHSMNLNTKYKEWSQENVGTASISSLSETETSFMDRITVIDGTAIFSEAIFLNKYNSIYYWNTIYNIKEILFIGLFVNTGEILKSLIYGVDFTYSDNKIVFLTALNYIDPLLEEQDLSISIRYKHSPQIHIIDSPRETIQTFVNINGEGEEVVSLPVHSIGRRSHYVLDRQNYDNSRIIDNSRVINYNDFNAPKIIC